MKFHYLFLSVATALAIPFASFAGCQSEGQAEEGVYVGKRFCASSKRAPALKNTSDVSVCNPTRFAIQARGAAFMPLKHQIREIYGSGFPTFQMEGSYSLFKSPWRGCDQFLLWENVGWTSKSGRSIGFGYYTKLNLVPISMGIEYQVNMMRGFDFYVGIGPSYSFLWIKNYDGFSTTHYNSSQFGFTTKTGFRYTFCTNYFLDVFGDYYYTQFKKMDDDPIQNIDTHFSGFFVGGGFGGKF